MLQNLRKEEPEIKTNEGDKDAEQIFLFAFAGSHAVDKCWYTQFFHSLHLAPFYIISAEKTKPRRGEIFIMAHQLESIQTMIHSSSSCWGMKKLVESYET